MRRRVFIAGLGGAAIAWPRAARAQPATRRVGYLTPNAAGDADTHSRFAALQDALRELGWREGSTPRIDARFGGGTGVRAVAQELVALEPEVIVAVAPTEIERAMAGLADQAGGALVMVPGPATLSHRNLIVTLPRATACRRSIRSAPSRPAAA